MKAIINGLRYDTEKSILIGEGGSDGGISNTDYQWWSASLYKTPRSGKYFLAGKGGPMTRFARHSGNCSYGSSGIQPMDKQEAFDFAERYLDFEVVESEFPDMIQDA